MKRRYRASPLRCTIDEVIPRRRRTSGIISIVHRPDDFSIVGVAINVNGASACEQTRLKNWCRPSKRIDGGNLVGCCKIEKYPVPFRELHIAQGHIAKGAWTECVYHSIF